MTTITLTTALDLYACLTNLASPWRNHVHNRVSEAGGEPDMDAWHSDFLIHLERRLNGTAVTSDGEGAETEWNTALAVATLVEVVLEGMSSRDVRLACGGEDAVQVQAGVLVDFHRLNPKPNTPEARRQRERSHWVRRLRREQRQAVAHLSAILGLVGGHGGQRRYASQIARDEHAAGMERCIAWARKHEMTNGTGSKIPLEELLLAGPRKRFATLYTLTVALDDVMLARGMAAMMVTMTLPPEYHPSPAAAGTSKYDVRLSPDAAVTELSRRFKKVREKLHRHGIRIFGYWVREPHKDGTPHLHALIYAKPEEMARIDGFVQRQFPEPDSWDGSEKTRVASTVVTIDRSKGKATTYMMKYLVKTLGTAGDGVLAADQATDGDSDKHGLADRDGIAAWRAERGGKTFGLIGLAQGVRGQWKMLAGQASLERVGNVDAFNGHPRLVEIIAAMKEKRWGDALDMMGSVPGDEPPTVETVTEVCISAYGEERKRPVGIAAVGSEDGALLRDRTWKIRPLGEGGMDASSGPRKEGDHSSAEVIPLAVERPAAVSGGGLAIPERAAAAPAT